MESTAFRQIESRIRHNEDEIRALKSRFSTIARGTQVIVGASSIPHGILSATHTDTLVAGVVKGDLLFGNATPKWARLPIGSSGDVLTVSGGIPVWTPAAATTHDLLSATHSDTLAASPVTGDVIVGNATPKWSRLARSVPAANVRNVFGLDNGDTIPAWKAALDATAPTTAAAGDAAAAGTSLIFSHRDHTHGMPATFPATAHNLLDGSAHGDTVAQSVSRGSLIYGNSTPKWDELVIGAAGSVLYSDGTDAAWTASPKIAGYVRVGSASVPANTTAGDLSTARLVVGTDMAFNAAGFTATLSIHTYTDTTTTATDVRPNAFVITATPASNSAAAFKNIYIRNDMASPSGVNLTGDPSSAPLQIASLHMQDGTINKLYGAIISPISLSSSSPATAGAVTSVAGIIVQMYERGSGTSTVAITRADGIRFFAPFQAGATITTYRAIDIGDSSASTITTFVGIEIAALAGGTTNIGIRNASNMVQTGYMRVGSTTVPANVTAGDLTVVRINIGNVAFTAGQTTRLASTTVTPAAGGLSTHLWSATITPDGSSGTSDFNNLTYNVQPSADNAGGTWNMFSLTFAHGSGAQALNRMQGFVLTISKTVAGVTGQMTGYRSQQTISAGTATTVNPFLSTNTLTGSTVTTLNHFEITITSHPTAGTTHRGLNIPNLGNAAWTSAIGIDLAAQSGATNNFAIRNAGNMVQTGYARFGAVTAPTNVTAGDVTVVRLKVGDGAFGTGVEFSVTGDGALSGFLRVGSETAPSNTTAGDVTATRLMVGSEETLAAVAHFVQGTLGNEVIRIRSVATNDDPTESVYQNRAATTDATVTTLHTQAIPATTTVNIEAVVTARRTGGSAGTAEDAAGYTIRGTFKNVAGTATLVGALTLVHTAEDQVAWDATIDVNSSNARVRVTGATNNNITWHVTIRVWSVGS